MEDIAKYKDAYLSEAKEHLDGMNKSLLKLEKNPGKLELINNIFREAHTLKSMAATMNYEKTASLCHAIEDVLDSIKKKKIKLDKCTDTLFECFDTLELTLKKVTRNEAEIDNTMLLDKLHTLSTKTGRLKAEPAPATVSAEQPSVSGVAIISSIEVKVERLDLLMNLAEELLINKMRLDRIKGELQNPELSAAVDAMGRLITDIQYNIMQSRLVPTGFIFNRFPRMVRDLAKHEKKEVNLLMEGSDIELDRSIIEEIGESLVHLLRNAVDHGMETPEERKKAGKPPAGTIKLSVTRTKSSAIIKVADDGMGLDFEDIKNTAVKCGILSPNAGKEEVIDSIFSGISTTKHITAVSGRGFGLDIVKDKIESFGGTIGVESEQKKGTTFIIEVPLTLAIIKTLFIEVGGKTYAVPLVNIERLVTVNKTEIKGMLGYEAIVLNEEDIPITRLSTLFNTQSLDLQKQPIVIISKGEEKLGMAVDALMGTQEIVIKPLNRLVKENKYFAGSTIIGSGEVVLILDVTNLILSKRTQVSV